LSVIEGAFGIDLQSEKIHPIKANTS